MLVAACPWWEGELTGCAFGDERLGQRLHKLIERMEGAIGASLPLACQDWANTKAAYRFFSNGRVSEAQILAGQFQATRDRFAATDGVILVLHRSGTGAAALERVFGAPLTWAHLSLSPGRSLSAAHSLSIPAIYAEASGGGEVRGTETDEPMLVAVGQTRARCVWQVLHV
jgi:hypothetical protein